MSKGTTIADNLSNMSGTSRVNTNKLRYIKQQTKKNRRFASLYFLDMLSA